MAGQLSISNIAASPTSPLIRVTTSAPHGFVNGAVIWLYNIVGTGNVLALNNTSWTITFINTTNFDLQASTFGGTYTSGGNVVFN